MIDKTESPQQKSDIFKWTLVTVLFLVALVSNYYFIKIALPIRMIGWIVVFSSLLGLAAWTSQGRTAIIFLNDAKMELRKVVWPSSQETIQTTGLIVLLVLIFGIILWGLDTLMLFLVGLFTG
jgi:preprotein translocase subunit SecE